MQERHGSRQSYARMEQSGDRYKLTPDEISLIQSRDGFYLSTVGENGWPYVQYRGGPIGFLKILDEQTLGLADFRGNRQYISTGNIEATGKACLFLMDYPEQARLKIWAEAEVVQLEENPGLISKLVPEGYPAVVERALLFHIQAYDWNCQQHIQPRYTLQEIKAALESGHPVFKDIFSK